MSYDDDFYTWTVTQGAIIREKRFDEIDVENVAEEIESWGHHFRYKLADMVALLQTCLLLVWVDKATGFTVKTRDVLRDEVEQMLEDYPGLTGELPAILADGWPRAVKYATYQTGMTRADFPEQCPWGIPELLLEYWYPQTGKKRESATPPDSVAPQNAVKARVVSDPGVLSGTPVLAGTRIPAANVMAEVQAGKSKFEIFESYPTLPVDGVEACIQWDKMGRPGRPRTS